MHIYYINHIIYLKSSKEPAHICAVLLCSNKEYLINLSPWRVTAKEWNFNDIYSCHLPNYFSSLMCLYIVHA